MRVLRKLRRDERGVLSGEFSILSAVICTAALASLRILVPHIINAYQQIASTLSG
ncbi:hypothetical protein [Desulfofundulus thermocisternus]|uniref:hypothetical protein n=1 Tax=Desulfofundulus thermocisternus TaxID=42471 RepID=UPI00217D0CCF|nr:hypothetical protein [Desulfofundulus thermocisternus]MCS5697381.1 hypothetical protein [Desulfofundulus thermocisternus]